MILTREQPTGVVPSSVILIDDDPSIHALVSAMLKPLGARVASALSGTEGLALVRESSPDLILLDNEMPDMNGLDVLVQLKADPRLAEIPVVMETGSENHRTLTSCFNAGALDYVRKPFAAAELRARVGSVLERQRMLSEMTRSARTDRLTGLANRSLLNDRLTRAIERARENEELAFAVMFLDFDRFKMINDTLGHEVGDLLLKGISGRLRANLRSEDTVSRESPGTTVARLGGDEFVVVLEGVGTIDAASAVADRLLLALKEPYQLGSHTVRSSASIGVVLAAPQYETADDMLRDADIAMYEAKARGKGCHVTFTARMGEELRARVDTENDLRDALGTDQIHLAYQPIISLDDRSVHGVEALVRWRHPVRGAIGPDQFIPIAEETGLILPLSNWILREACEAFMRWHTTAPDAAPRYVSVNLSRVQFGDPELVPRILGVLQELGMRPDQLQLEVTESQIMQNRGTALEALAQLRAPGIRLAMDDFGTGYSSLSCLQEFPLDTLKVDRSFVANAKRGRDYAALLHAVVTLADNLGLTVVAEGIEEEQQLVLLQALGCGFGQGYLIARPMPEADIARLLGIVPSVAHDDALPCGEVEAGRATLS